MRSPRTRSVRFRILVVLLIPLLTLVPLWGFTLYLTVPDGLNFATKTIRYHPEVGDPSAALGGAVAEERRATLVHLASPSSGTREELTKTRETTDSKAKRFAKIDDSGVLDVTPPATRTRVEAMQDQVDKLDSVRASVDSGTLDADEAYDYYTGMSDRYLGILLSLTSIGDTAILSGGKALQRTTGYREELLQEDAMMSAGLAGGTMDRQEHARFVEQVGAARSAREDAIVDLPASMREKHNEVWSSDDAKRMRAMEDAVVEAGPGRLPDGVTAKEWDDISSKVIEEHRLVEYDTANLLKSKMAPLATGIFVRAGAAILVGLIGVGLSILVSVRMGRRLIRETTDLKEQMQDVANTQLPNLVRRLRDGRHVDATDIGPSKLAFQIHTKELDDLNWAFDEARRVAVRSATGEAKLRENVNDVIINLARRNQALLHRQLKLFDELERRVSDPDQLRDLFLLDHLATRMRRHAEGLLILSGSMPGRGWSKPMPVIDIVRAASTEVEEYTRVSVFPMSSTRVIGSAVTDVIHLLAELIENATFSSPQTSEVLIRGRDVANGFAVEIEDGGLGMSEQSLEDANALLADPPELDLARRTELGHFVVATLAKRHGIKVHLRDSPYGGITAIVLLPRAILSPDDRPGIAEDTQGETSSEGRHAAEPAVREERRSAVRTASVQELPAGYDGPVAVPDPPHHPASPPEGSPEGQPDQPAPSPAGEQNGGEGGRRGLPRRVRQTNLVPQLRDDTTGAPGGPTDERPPEETRSMMSAMQSGWQRGRDDDPASGGDASSSFQPSENNPEGSQQ